MTTTELIIALRDTNNHNSIPEKSLLNETADKLEQLQKLIDDFTNDHYVDTLDFYAERCHKLEEDFHELVMKSIDICDYCKHNTECKGKDCPKYISGKGCIDENGKELPDWEWDCTDFDFGTCPMLEDTPCNGCIKNSNKGFEWRGER